MPLKGAFKNLLSDFFSFQNVPSSLSPLGVNSHVTSGLLWVGKEGSETADLEKREAAGCVNIRTTG